MIHLVHGHTFVHEEDMLGHPGHKASAGLRALAIAAALSGLLGSAAAQEQKEQARNAAIGDGVSTAVGLAVGAAELNPLGPIMSVGMKFVVFEYVETLPDTEQPRAYAMANSTWSGAVANNLCVTASLLTGGGFAPACIALGVAWGMKTWQESEHERQFWEGCALLRTYAEQPDLECVYQKPVLQAADEPRTYAALPEAQ